MNITCPYRFSNLQTASAIVKNRQLDPNDKRPIALFIYAKEDWNQSSMGNRLSEVLEKKYYNLLYYEAGNEDDLYSAIREAGTYGRIDFLMIGGHGTKTCIALGAPDPAKTEMQNERLFIDLSDEKELAALEVYLQYILIGLEACSTAEGGKGAKNLANMFIDIFPNCQPIASTAPNGTFYIQYKPNGRIHGLGNIWYDPAHKDILYTK